MKVIVFGATGGVGRLAVKSLLADGHEVTAFARRPQALEISHPRLNRLAHGYPFLRAAMCVFMRDISANIAIMDMMRGAASIYMLYLGVDKVYDLPHHNIFFAKDYKANVHDI